MYRNDGAWIDKGNRPRTGKSANRYTTEEERTSQREVADLMAKVQTTKSRLAEMRKSKDELQEKMLTLARKV